MQDRHLTLFIPSLLGGSDAWCEPHFFAGLVADELELMLSRAVCRRYPAETFEGTLFRLFGHAGGGAELPVTAVTHVIDRGAVPEEYCLRADPVHLVPDRDKVVMFGNQQLSVSAAEAQQLVDEFNRLFAGEGMRLEAPAPQRWYLMVDRHPHIATQSLAAVMGKDIHPHLPTGEKALEWHRFLNEVQMLFYNSSVNEARRQRGMPEINSIWLWGEGELSELAQQPWQQVWSNDVTSRGLAQLSGCRSASLPASAEEWLEQAGLPGHHLVVMDVAAEAVQEGDVARWREIIETLNEAWLAVLSDALRTNSLASIRLLSDNAEFHLTARALKKWWKRRRPLLAMQ
jgi:hypothetical protein